MPYTSPQTAQIFKIAGLPQSGSATIFFRTLSLYGPSSTAYDFSAQVTALNAILASHTADQQALVIACLTQWTANNLDFNEQEVYADSGTMGILSHAGRQRANIRASLDDIIGIGIPPEGFLQAVRASLGGGSNRCVK